MRFAQLHLFSAKVTAASFLSLVEMSCGLYFVSSWQLICCRSLITTTCYYNIEKVQITVVYIVTVFHSI